MSSHFRPDPDAEPFHLEIQRIPIRVAWVTPTDCLIDELREFFVRRSIPTNLLDEAHDFWAAVGQEILPALGIGDGTVVQLF
jgi:hypothetical protein